MKFDNFKNADDEDISGNITSTEAGISQENLGLIFDMVSTQMYKNPIGSIVREITSNCFDSHIEAGANDAVVLTIDKDDEGLYISFTDFGVGISPERMKTIYMNYFSSTKRDSNDQIGGFGLGSKSPLAYADYFHIITRHANIEYSYILSKGSKKPTLDLLTETPTEERNGTVIKIYIKEGDEFNSNSDVVRFTSEIRKQLLYFDNVYFNIRAHGLAWNGKHDITNDYKILEFEHFKFRTDVAGNPDSNDRGPHAVTNVMHICYGKVNYPIDWNEISMSPIHTPVGIRFEIGELMVTPNRESLRYTDEIKSLIVRKIKDVCKELEKEFFAQNKDIYDLKEYFFLMNSKPHISFKEGEETYVLNLRDIKGIKPTYVFKPLEEIGCIATGSIINEHEWHIAGSISAGKKSSGRFRNYIHELIVDDIRGVIVNGNPTSFYRNRFIKKCDLIRKHSLSIAQVYRKYLHLVGGSMMHGGFGSGEYFSIGVAKKIYQYRKIVEAEIHKMFDTYENIVVPNDFKAEIAPKRVSTKELRESQKMIRIYDLSSKSYLDEKPVDILNHTTNRNGKPSGLLIYGFRENMDMLEKAYIILSQKENMRNNYLDVELAKGKYKSFISKYKKKGVIRFDFMPDQELERAIYLKDSVEKAKASFRNNRNTSYNLNSKSARVIMIAKKDENNFQPSESVTHVGNLFSDNKIFKEIATAALIEDFDFIPNHSEYGYKKEFPARFAPINKRIAEVCDFLQKYVKKRTFNDVSTKRYSAKEVRKEIVSLAEKANLFDKDILSLVKEVTEYFEGADMLKFTVIDEENMGYIAKYLKDKGKPVNHSFYVNGIYDSNGKLIEKGSEEVLEVINDGEDEDSPSKFLVKSLVPPGFFSYNCVLNQTA